METSNELQNNIEESILTDLEPTLVLASTGKRFANYIIDIVVFYLFLIIVAIIIAVISPGLLDFLDSEELGFKLLDRLISLIIYGLFMGVIEGLTKGRSLGKLITGTKAVNQHDGSRITFGKAMMRGFCRMVPFNPFSGLSGYPWHDKWTDTYVIDIKQTGMSGKDF